MSSQKIFQIDLNQVLHSKAPQKAKKIPKFVINILSRIICQNGLNDFLRFNNNDTGVDFMRNAIKYFDISFKIIGEENIPDSDEKFIFASTHPLGGLDGICLSAFLGEKYEKKIKYLVNDLLYFIEPLQNIFIPINKHGAQAKEAVKTINDTFYSPNQIITFPAGLCSRKIQGKIQDLEWKKMFIIKAVESQRDIIPVLFEGKNSHFFYGFSNFRKALGIKFNIEMLFLPREMFKSKGSTFTIHFGKPIAWETFGSSKSPHQWAQEVRKQVYQLAQNER
jgi:putative hemolysin